MVPGYGLEYSLVPIKDTPGNNEEIATIIAVFLNLTSM